MSAWGLWSPLVAVTRCHMSSIMDPRWWGGGEGALARSLKGIEAWGGWVGRVLEGHRDRGWLGWEGP